MDSGIFVVVVGVIVAGLAGVLGVWMERDSEGPRRWAYIFSVLIVSASSVEMAHALNTEMAESAIEDKLAALLGSLGELAAKGDNPALQQFVGAELAIQSRANPQLVKRMQDDVAERGGDPKALQATADAARRLNAGLAAQPPEDGELPRLAPAFMGSAGAPASVEEAAAQIEGKAEEVVTEVTETAKAAAAQATEQVSAAAEEAKASATQAVEDTTASATKAVDDTKAQATKAKDDTKAKAKNEANKAKDDAKSKAGKAADRFRR